MEKNKSLAISIIVLTCGVILSSVWLGYSVQKSTELLMINSTSDSNVLIVSQAANYIAMSEEEIHGIINTEKHILEQTGSFSGMRFPYFIVNEKQYFYKGQLDEWLKEVSNEHRQYYTKKDGFLIKDVTFITHF